MCSSVTKFTDMLIRQQSNPCGGCGSCSDCLLVERKAGLTVEEEAHWFASPQDAIRQGLDDVEHGRTRPAQEVFDEIRETYSIPRDSMLDSLRECSERKIGRAH